MADGPKILAFAGSTREGSLNKRLLRVAVPMAREAGADVTAIDLRDFPMPLYDGDLEDREGIPEHSKRLKALMIASQGFLIVTPEYNSATPGVLKNAIDWASREAPGEGPLACFRGKVAGLMAASPGHLGGLRSLFALRQILSNIRVLVIPDQFALAKADQAFDDSGSIKDPKQVSSVRAVVARLVDVTRRLTP